MNFEMTMIFENDAAVLREFEQLRGFPIEVVSQGFVAGYQEQSDSELLCGNPLVSVLMITYNHERYIRQAIDSIVTQDCDFEFELIIGEDCSTDRTREICLDFQERYPKIIRVVFSECNVGALRNLFRIENLCRGEFIAICEGDDSWRDPYKLKKQVDVFLLHPTVVLTYSNMVVRDASGKERNVGAEFGGQGDKLIPGKTFLDAMFSPTPQALPLVSVMYREAAYRHLAANYDIFRWNLCQRDIALFAAHATIGDIHIIDDFLVLRNENPKSLMHTIPYRVYRDGALVMYYFSLLTERSLWDRKRMVIKVLQRRLEQSFSLRYRGRIMEVLKVASCSRKYRIGISMHLALLSTESLLGFGPRWIRVTLLLLSMTRDKDRPEIHDLTRKGENVPNNG